MRRYLWGALFWAPLASLIIPFLLLGGFDWRSDVLSLAIAEVIFTVVHVGLQILRWVRRQWLKSRGLPEAKLSASSRMLQGLVFMLPSVWIGLKSGQITAAWLGFKWDTLSFMQFTSSLIWGVISLLIFWVISVYNEMKTVRRELEKKHLEARLALITSRLNPHFLFNALNSVVALIGSAPVKAEAFTISLSDYYRQVLMAMEKEVLPLAEELELCRSYLVIEEVRFGQRLRYRLPDLSSDPLGKVRVPGLCLQPLVENALKHGILPAEEGGSIEIQVNQRGQELHIAVWDDGEGLSAPSRQPGSGTALKNLRERLILMYGNGARLDVEARSPRGVAATIVLPYSGAET